MITMITFEPLWETMKEKGVSQYYLIKNGLVSAGQLSRLRANSNVSTHTIDMLCEILDCNVDDIMKHISSKTEDNVNKK